MDKLEELLNNNLDNLDVSQVMSVIKEKVQKQREVVNYYFKPCLDIIKLISREDETKEINDNLRFANLNFNTRHKSDSAQITLDIIKLISREDETKEINDNLHFANLNFNTRHTPDSTQITEVIELHANLHKSLSKINRWFYDYPLIDKSFKSRLRKILKKTVRPFLLYQNIFNVQFTCLLNNLIRLYDHDITGNIHYNAHIVRTLNSIVTKMFKADQIFIELNNLIRLYDQETTGNIHYNAHIVRTLNSIVTKMFKADQIFIEWSEDLSRSLYLFVEKNRGDLFEEVERRAKRFEEYIQESQKQFKEYIRETQRQFEELYKNVGDNNASIAEAHKTINFFTENVNKEIEELSKNMVENNTSIEDVHKVINLFNERLTEDASSLREHINENVREINEILTLKTGQIEELYKALSGNNTSIAEVHKSINSFTKNTDRAIGDLSKNVAGNNKSIEKVHNTINVFNKRLDKDTSSLREYINENINEINEILTLKESQITELYTQAHNTNGQIESVHKHLNSYTGEIFELQKRLDKVDKEVDKEINERVKEYRNLLLAIKSLRNRFSEIKVGGRKLMSDSPSEKVKQKGKENIVDSYQVMRNFDFYAFEEWARGSEEFVVSQQEDYVKFFAGKGRILDIGCGRGEFLELLRKEGINSYGIDTDINMLAHCKEKGLEVFQSDALSYLESLNDNLLGGIFAGQLIEHLSTSDLITLIELAYDKLTPDGLIILETVNPTNLTTFSGSFYADPTHIKPVHPVPLEFFMEKAGFRDVNIHYSVPFPKEGKLNEFDIPDHIRDHTRKFFQLYNQNIGKLNQLLFGYANYAMIAYK